MTFLTIFKTLFGLNPDAFTFYGGGGGGGKSESTTQQQLDPTVRPFVEYGLQESKALYQTPGPAYYPYQTYVSPSAQTQQALQAGQSRATAGSPLVPAAQQQLQNIGQTAEDYQQRALDADIARYEYQQNLPYTKLQNFLSAAYGAPMGQVTTSSSSGGGK